MILFVSQKPMLVKYF